MGLDLVEIALNSMTDGFAFEKLASEVMREEGYYDIKPLGGTNDFGQDAFQDRFYYREGRHARIVFQYTLEDYIAGKLRDTAAKLSDKKVEFSELVIVTSASLSSRRQRELILMAREEFDLTLHIYERKTIVNRLAALDNGIFYRHFSGIEQQLELVRSGRPKLEGSETEREAAMLKVSIALVFGRETDPVRKSIFDHLILATLLVADTPHVSLAEISHSVSSGLGCEPFPSSQIAASLRRLETRELVASQDGQYSLTDKAVRTIEGANAEAISLSDSAISDIVEEVCNVSGLCISGEERNRLERNARDVLVEIFRLMGIELANQFLEKEMPSPLYLESSNRILELARRQINGNLGELLIAALAEAIQNPTPEQSQMLASRARAFLGTAVMNLDPALREFQATRLRQKVFILDTDFVLRCIVDEDPDNKTYLGLVQRLVDLSCRLVIPEAVVDECATHARLSPRTYNHFGDRLLGLTSAFVERKVNNEFVKGYYYGKVAKQFPQRWSFDDYLQNYYDSADPQGFLTEVIRAKFPSAVEIIDPTTLTPTEIPSDLVKKMSTELLEMLKRSPKSEYRTAQQNEELAVTDARLFVTALQLNSTASARDTTNCILGGTCYIVTSSSKYLRGAKTLNIRDVVTTRPQKLLALMEIATGPVVDDVAFVKLFENPFLIHAVEQLWPDVSLLLANGIALTGKRLVRLKWDLDDTLHARISALKNADERAEDEEDEDEDVAADAGDHEYMELVREAASRGYPLHPALGTLRDAFIQAKDEAESEKVAREQLQERFDQLSAEIERFGKKKQRYLRRVARWKERGQK